MDFKLPHDVVSAFAKRDELPSRRRPARASLAYGPLLMAHGWLATSREADSYRRAAGSRWNSFAIGFHYPPINPPGDYRRLRGGN